MRGIILLFFHSVVRVESVFMSLLRDLPTQIAEISRQILVVLGGHSRGDPSRVVLVIRAAAAGSLGEIFRFRIDVSILNLLAVGTCWLSERGRGGNAQES